MPYRRAFLLSAKVRIAWLSVGKRNRYGTYRKIREIHWTLPTATPALRLHASRKNGNREKSTVVFPRP